MINKEALLKEMAEQLGKRECKLIRTPDKNHVLCGTNLVYEDEVWNSVRDVLIELDLRFGFHNDKSELNDDYIDEASELRDMVLDYVLKSNNADIIYGCEEF